MSLALKKNDKVVVLAGKSKGKQGKMLRLNNDGSRAFVEGVNLVKRFLRPSKENPQGGTVERETSIHMSNLALYCGKCKKGVRFTVKVLEDKSKVRHCCKCDTDLNLN